MFALFYLINHNCRTKAADPLMYNKATRSLTIVQRWVTGYVTSHTSSRSVTSLSSSITVKMAQELGHGKALFLGVWPRHHCSCYQNVPLELNTLPRWPTGTSGCRRGAGTCWDACSRPRSQRLRAALRAWYVCLSLSLSLSVSLSFSFWMIHSRDDSR